MRVLFVCENYIPHYGGAEVVFKNLAEGFVKRGHTVTLVTHQLRGTKRKEMMNGVRVIRVPSMHSRYMFSFAAIPTVIRLAKKHDIVQTTSFNGAPPAWLAARLTRKPVVITVHEIWKGKWQKITGFSWWKSFIHEMLERMIYSLPYNKYVTVSNATRRDVIKAGIPKRKSITIHNGFDHTFWNSKNFPKKESTKIRNELNLKDKFVCFSWGRPGASKGFKYLLRSVPIIKRSIPNFKLLLMLGSKEKYPKQYKELLNLIKKLRIRDCVKLIPTAPYEKLGNYIRAVDCIVVPSTSEGFGYNVVEANSLGVPLVASDAGSIPEVISGKHLLFRSKNVRDLAAKVIRVSKGKFEKTPQKKFPWKDSIDRYLQLYQEILHRKKKQNPQPLYS